MIQPSFNIIGLACLVACFFSITSYAAPAPGKEPSLLEQIYQLRLKQEDEEQAQRIIQQPTKIIYAQECLPIDQVRQRLKELQHVGNRAAGDVTITAGHDNVTVTDNDGIINNNVNVQIIKKQCESLLINYIFKSFF